MFNPKSDALTEKELESVAGGWGIDFYTSKGLGRSFAPTKQGGSIAQQDTLDNTLTDNNLPS
jgi:hypothetical protein